MARTKKIEQETSSLDSYELYRRDMLRIKRLGQGPDPRTDRIERILGWAVNRARRRMAIDGGLRSSSELMDLTGAANVGIMRADRKFHPEWSVEFITYATDWIDSEVRKQARADRKQAGMADLDAQLDDESDLTLADTIVDNDTHLQPEPQALRQDTREQLLTLMRELLLPREEAMLRQCFGIDNGQPMTVREYADQVGISHQRVSKIANRALGKLGKDPRILELAKQVTAVKAVARKSSIDEN